MRVQRAPLAADQPQRPPAGLTPAPSPHPAPAGLTGLTPAPSPHPAPAGLTPAPSPHPGPAGLTGQAGGAPAPFSAEVSLDLTGQCRQLQDPVRVTAVVIAGLLAACRTEGLLEESWTLCVLRPTADGVLGTFAGEAVGLSADGIAAALSNLTPGFAAPASPAAMTVVDLSATSVGVTGDWGYGGRAVATLGAIVPDIGPGDPDLGPGLRVARRSVARLSLTVREPRARAHSAVRALDALARSMQEWNR